MMNEFLIIRSRLVLLFSLFITTTTLIAANLEDLSKTDINLDKQFINLFSRELGHTLIGTKPMSCEEWFWRRSTSPQSKERIIDFLRWAFADSKIFILHIDSPHPSLIDITLIHKPLLIETAQREKYLKNFIEAQYKTIDNFFECLRLYKGNIFKKFHYNDHALGLAFGYGEENSAYASRRMEIQEFLCRKKKLHGLIILSQPNPGSIIRACKVPPPHITLPPQSITPSKRFCFLEEELSYLISLEMPVQEVSIPYLFSPPFLIAKRCDDTDRIMKHYSRSTEKLAKIYLNKPFSQFLIEHRLFKSS